MTGLRFAPASESLSVYLVKVGEEPRVVEQTLPVLGNDFLAVAVKVWPHTKWVVPYRLLELRTRPSDVNLVWSLSTMDNSSGHYVCPTCLSIER